MVRSRFTAASFLYRWLVALLLVLATFNPTRLSYLHWVADLGGENLPLKVLIGMILLILFAIYLRATWRAIGATGLVLALAFFAALVWAIADLGLLDPTAPGVAVWLILLVLSVIMAIGLSWSHIRRRLSGQADVDDVDP